MHSIFVIHFPWLFPSFFLQDILSLEPFLFVGLPAAAVVRLVLRSLHSEGLDFVEVQVTAANRPHNAFADSSWALYLQKTIAEIAGMFMDKWI